MSLTLAIKQWLNYYFVLLDCFPLLLPFITSLIKFILWNSGKAQEAKVFLHTRGRLRTWGGLSQEDPVGSCSVTVIQLYTFLKTHKAVQ